MPRLAIAALMAATLTAGVAADSHPLNSSVRMLRSAVTTQRDGSHLALLLSLRQLKDPMLRPFFDQLLKHEHWAMQTHAVLGLAEISERGGIDPWLLTQVQPLAQEAIVTAAIEQGLFNEEAQRQALEQNELSSLARLLLLAQRVQQGHELDPNQFRHLKDDETSQVSALARLLLAQVGDAEPFMEWFEQQNADDSRRSMRRQIPYWLLEVIREYELDAVAAWVDEQFDAGYWRNDLEQHAIVTLLKIAPERGSSRWRSFVVDASSNESEGDDRSVSYRQRMQATFMLLALTPKIPIDLLEHVEGDETLLRSIVRAAKAFSRGPDAAEPMLELFTRGHNRSMDWVISAARHLPDDEAERIYIGVLDLIDDPPIGRGSYTSFVIPAIAELVKLNPGLVNKRLVATPRNSHAREVMLLGLFESSDPIVTRLASDLPRIGIGRSDSMALLLVAKHAESLDHEAVQQLGTIASGGGRVSNVLRVQAAWLYLKHSGQVEAALARTFAD